MWKKLALFAAMVGLAAAAPAQARPVPMAPDRIAARFTTDYLRLWSGANARTIGATPGLYARTVRFHGRTMNLRALVAEKRAFVQRWPERRYSPRPGTMRVACAGAGLCTVRTVFDFAAASAKRKRRSAGSGTLRLDLELRGARPVIVGESSRVLNRRSG